MRLTKAERKVLAKMQRAGARALNAKLTPAQRTESARHAANARWKAARAPKPSGEAAA